MLLQLAFVLLAIVIGARIGGIGLGVLGGLGLAILTFFFGLEPTAPPIDVMLMIVAVIAAASCMQAAGGLDLMVKWAEKLLRKNPQRITLLSPLVTYLFTFVAGTGHVAYSVLPVIAEVAQDTKIRPERPMAIAVIASQQAITASPISAATVALLSMLSGYGISLMDILMVSVPCTLIGVLAGALYSLRVGKELKDDPEYQRRMASGELGNEHYRTNEVANPKKAALAVSLFLMATLGIVLFGSMESLRPIFETPDGNVVMEMSHIIEVLMLTAAALIEDRWNTCGARFGILGRNAGGSGYLRYCVDGRYVHSWQYGGLEREHCGYSYPDALVIRIGSVCDVYPSVQPGGHDSCLIALRHCVGDIALYADSSFPGGKRLFFHSELSYGSSRHQF